LDVLANAVTDRNDIRPIVSFNGFGYDLPVLMRRSQYLGIAHPFISLDRYRSPHIDLMQKLTFNGQIKAHKLRFYSSRFGMAVEDPHDGAEIAALVKAGDWKAVESHCLADLAQTRFIAQKLKLIPSAQTVAQEAGAAF
jgi:predicted PolB exonuclease-like 3'-5' exonuclease